MKEIPREYRTAFLLPCGCTGAILTKQPIDQPLPSSRSFPFNSLRILPTTYWSPVWADSPSGANDPWNSLARWHQNWEPTNDDCSDMD